MDLLAGTPSPRTVVAKRLVEKGETYKGQTQIRFVARFAGQDSDIKLQEEEIRKYKWVNHEDIEEHFTFPNQRENIKEVINKSSIKI